MSVCEARNVLAAASSPLSVCDFSLSTTVPTGTRCVVHAHQSNRRKHCHWHCMRHCGWLQTCLPSRTPSLPIQRCACWPLRSVSSQLKGLCKGQNRIWTEPLRISRRSNKSLLLGYALPTPTPAVLIVMNDGSAFCCCANQSLVQSTEPDTCHCIVVGVSVFWWRNRHH